MLQGAEGASQISVKWDGAPAIFCGTNPENGKFFVATKSLFNATPKINYTNADIKRNHGGALADKLTVALKYFPKLGIKGVLQGDLLFTSGDKKTEVVDGKSSIVFTPNTITYAVPVVKTGILGSSLYKRVNAAKIGIIFHTSYSGKTIKDLSASFGAGVSGLKKNRDVFFDDAMYKQTNPGFTRTEEIAFDNIIRMSEGSAYKAGKFIDKIKKDKNTLSLGVQLKTFFNTYIREGTPITNTKSLANNFEVYFRDKIQKEIDKYNKALNVSDLKKLAVSGIYGASEVATEMLTTVRLVKDLKSANTLFYKEGFAPAFKQAIKDIPLGGALEGGGEGLNNIIGNVADITILKEDNNAFDGVTESAAQGFFIGNGFKVANVGSLAKAYAYDIITDKQNKQEIKSILKEINNLSSAFTENTDINTKAEAARVIRSKIKELSLNEIFGY